MKISINAVAALLLLSVCTTVQAGMKIVDMAGRSVNLPDRIEKVIGDSPPATFMAYAIDPKLVAGINSSIGRSAAQFLDPGFFKLPVTGGWLGQGRITNPEVLLQIRPDLVLMRLMKKSAAYEEVERDLKQFNIPVVYIKIDSIEDYPAAFLFLGTLFKREKRAGALAGYARETLQERGKIRDLIPQEHRVSVYYAEGADGLSTECDSSIHSQIIELSWGENVHKCEDYGNKGMQRVSLEQVALYDPKVIISADKAFIEKMSENPGWQTVSAVRKGAIFKIPSEPLNWLDRPPSFMRLLGLKWLMHTLYPSEYRVDMVAETRRFFELFLNVSIDEATAQSLLSQG